ncbi:hypothetical protein BTVI_105874 [Pitangus sulphuratus]|nr:hypothetical protein BTVI_105874 [Pitangus sulphuratus]
MIVQTMSLKLHQSPNRLNSPCSSVIADVETKGGVGPHGQELEKAGSTLFHEMDTAPWQWSVDECQAQGEERRWQEQDERESGKEKQKEAIQGILHMIDESQLKMPITVPAMGFSINGIVQKPNFDMTTIRLEESCQELSYKDRVTP